MGRNRCRTGATLTTMSQRRNVKLRDLAHDIVDHITSR